VVDDKKINAQFRIDCRFFAVLICEIMIMTDLWNLKQGWV